MQAAPGCKQINLPLAPLNLPIRDQVADPMAETSFYQEQNGEFHKTLMKTYSASDLSQIQIFWSVSYKE